MTTVKTKGIVLKTMPYKETALLVTIYSLEFGKITLNARGARKMTSKNASIVMPLSMSTFEISPRQGLSTLIRGDVISYYTQIKKDIDKEIIADYLLEYYYRYVPENKPSLEDFDFLSGALEALEKGFNVLYIYALINVFIMKSNGVSLQVDHCVFCDSTKVVDYSLDDGGFVCHDHHTGIIHYHTDALQAIRYLYKIDIHHVAKLHLEDDVVKRVLPIFDYYVEEYIGIHLKSKKFLKQIV